jgi:succinate-semialdehyde dehydrogenase/glutarate-semialdehyde dehydrogenase
MFVAGAWTGAETGETFTADSPATGETIGEIPQGGREDARRAIDAANAAALVPRLFSPARARREAR